MPPFAVRMHVLSMQGVSLVSWYPDGSGCTLSVAQ
jgi:hypothetical protein